MLAHRRLPTHRPPTHPGEILLEEFIRPAGLTQRAVAQALRMPYQRLNEIVRGKRGITPSTALRLARFFGTTADFWLNLQLNWDLYWALQKEADLLQTIQPWQAKAEAPQAHLAA